MEMRTRRLPTENRLSTLHPSINLPAFIFSALLFHAEEPPPGVTTAPLKDRGSGLEGLCAPVQKRSKGLVAILIAPMWLLAVRSMPFGFQPDVQLRASRVPPALFGAVLHAPMHPPMHPPCSPC